MIKWKCTGKVFNYRPDSVCYLKMPFPYHLVWGASPTGVHKFQGMTCPQGSCLLLTLLEGRDLCFPQSKSKHSGSKCSPTVV